MQATTVLSHKEVLDQGLEELNYDLEQWMPSKTQITEQRFAIALSTMSSALDDFPCLMTATWQRIKNEDSKEFYRYLIMDAVTKNYSQLLRNLAAPLTDKYDVGYDVNIRIGGIKPIMGTITNMIWCENVLEGMAFVSCMQTALKVWTPWVQAVQKQFRLKNMSYVKAVNMAKPDRCMLNLKYADVFEKEAQELGIHPGGIPYLGSPNQVRNILRHLF